MKHFLSTIKGVADKEIEPRKYLILLCGIFFGICIFAALFIFVLDPYAYFHKSWLLKPHFDRSYAMVPGLLRHEEYDTVLFGSSISQNFKLTDLDSLYNGKSIKAVSPGLPAEALGTYISIALQKSSFRHGIVAIDFMAFAKHPETSPRLRYEYLYQDSFFPAKYLLSIDSMEAACRLIRGNFRLLLAKDDEVVEDMDRNYMFGWYKKSSRSRLEAGVRKTKKIKRFPPAVPPQAVKYMEKYLFSHIRNNPNHTFDLYLPPYHVYFWCNLKYAGKLEGYLALRDHFLSEIPKFPNVKVHDFQTEPKVFCNMELYQDESHYDQKTNAWMAVEMKKGSYLINDISGKKNTLKLRKLILQHYPDYLNL